LTTKIRDDLGKRHRAGEVQNGLEQDAVEFLRRELSSHGYYSKVTLVSALVDLRSGGRVALSRELDSGDHLPLEVVPVTA